MQQIPVTISHY